MSRFCDDLMAEPTWYGYNAAISNSATSPAGGGIRESWRHAMMCCERFEVSPMVEALAQREDGEAPSLRLPYPQCWIESRFEMGRMGGLFQERRNADVNGNESWEIVAALAYQRPDGRCVIPSEHPATLAYYRASSGDERLVQDWTFPDEYGAEDGPPHAWMLSTLLYAISQLNYKTVGSELVVPPPKVQAKRAKRGRPPLYSYRTLTVKMGGKVRPATDLLSGSHRDMRLHKVRAHYKWFTRDRPLFGRIVGPVRCPPHERGKKANGVIEKDYRLEPPALA